MKKKTNAFAWTTTVFSFLLFVLLGLGAALLGRTSLLARADSSESYQDEIDEAYELNTGKVIIETFEELGLNPMYTPAVLCTNHGPFTWGKDAAQAVYHAVVLEEVAKMALRTEMLKPGVEPAPQRIADKHFYRKHGANAYYGQ